MLTLSEEALDRHSRALALPKPASIYTDSLVNWMDGMKPVIEAESHFLDTPRDLVTLAPLGQGERNGVLENWIEKRWSRLFSTEVCSFNTQKQTKGNGLNNFRNTANARTPSKTRTCTTTRRQPFVESSALHLQ
jgi:hypothetical protein